MSSRFRVFPRWQLARRLRQGVHSRRRLAVCVIIMVHLFLAGPAYALMEMTEEEYALLPEYCRHKGAVSTSHPVPPRSPKWEAYLGSDFEHIHHYCWALVWIARSYRVGTTERDRAHYLGVAEGDIKYSLRHTADKSPLRAELLTKQMEIKIQLRNERAAEQVFREVLRTDASYWRAYTIYGYYLHQIGKQQAALSVVELGKKNLPDSPHIQRLASEIRSGGKASRK